MKLIFVSGVSRAGKTSTISEFQSNHPDWAHIICSEILKKNSRPIARLSYELVQENQNFLVAALQELLPKCGSNIFLDGHLILPSREGDYVVSDDFLNQVSPNGIVCIVDSPKVISKRLRQTKKVYTTAREVKLKQRKDFLASVFQAKRLGIPFLLLRSGDIHKLEQWASKISDKRLDAIDR